MRLLAVPLTPEHFPDQESIRVYWDNIEQNMRGYLFVLAFDSFDHWQDKDQGLKEVYRVLKSTGRFVVVKDGGVPNNTSAKREFITALDKAGFKVHEEQTIEKDGVKFTHWVCIIKS